ncbi:hypothetical protein LIER_08648 [Lithospermum erythrorhizon]|uniref:Uncharacterized protein n=1 Tax=Lithospermum erythrorhizon TaxID=34254 RepID=A0AAV3PCZ2_LITER
MMDDGAFTRNTLLDVLSDDAMDELISDGFWLEAAYGSNFSQQSGPQVEPSKQNINMERVAEENQSPAYPQVDEVCENEEQTQETILPSSNYTQIECFLVEGIDMNRRLRIGPIATPVVSVKKRLEQAIEYLNEYTRDKDILIQIWVPIVSGGRHVLTTNNQPFSINPNSQSLADYRHVSENYQLAAEENSKELIGLPGRVFLTKLPEWTPDVQFFKREEYPRVTHARQFKIRGSVALPVFQRSGTCLGVVEIVTTARKVNYRPELEDVCKALEAVDLRSSCVSRPPRVEDANTSYQAVLAEIQNVLKCVCGVHKLPLAQTWAPCTQQGKGGCRHSDENYTSCVSTVDNACFVLDPQVQLFHEACFEHHLLKGEGVAGNAFMTNQPCFNPDLKTFCKTEYPLAHHARMFELGAAVAIRLRSDFTGSADFVLEFFLPLDCKDPNDQNHMLNSLSSMVQHICQTLRVVTDQELAEEMKSLVGEKCSSSFGKPDDNKTPEISTSPDDPQLDASSWLTHMMNAQEKGKGISISVDSPEETEDEFRLTSQWNNQGIELNYMATIPEHIQAQQDSSSDNREEGIEELSSISGLSSSGARRAGERRRTKLDKSISLDKLRQYFSGTLKDAAKNIGVSATTLKRICRQYGISRWPSRKVKKVGHSLRKLQLVIDSVQGAKGAIKLSSFYSNFPELCSPNETGSSNNCTMLKKDEDSKKPDICPEGDAFIPLNDATKSPSGSHISGPSFCCSAGSKDSHVLVNTSTARNISSAEQSREVLKKAFSDPQLLLSGQEESKLLLRSQTQKIFTEPSSLEDLPPLPMNRTEVVPETAIVKVKASFGVENIRFTLQPHWGFKYLHRELLRRFCADNVGRIDIKYLDDDSEWILLKCDEDLDECLGIHRSSGTRTIKMSLHRANHPGLESSFGSSCPF